ncbi:hypothetical protein IMZ48_39895 [Candidatus Bathyarchaeota archaeon]|nr:hypothetical protein [Candidatus Bathyarchaeota archaeon]
MAQLHDPLFRSAPAAHAIRNHGIDKHIKREISAHPAHTVAPEKSSPNAHVKREESSPHPAHTVAPNEHAAHIVTHSVPNEREEINCIPPGPVEVYGHEEWVVKGIMGHEDRKINGNAVRWYRVRWEGYQPEDDTMEPGYHLFHAREMLLGYEMYNLH